jgi:hypothetical protein
MKTERKPYLISPLDKGFQVDSIKQGKPHKSGHSARKNAINAVLRQIPVNHQITIIDMGEVNYAKD